MQASDIKQLRDLEDENRRLKRMSAPIVTLKHATVIFAIVLVIAFAANGQRTPTKGELDRAQFVLSRAFNSESDAESRSRYT